MQKKRNLYFERYAYSQTLLQDYTPTQHLEMVVVIPSFHEPDTTGAVRSLLACEKPVGQVAILVVVNEPERASEAIRQTNEKTLAALEALPTPDWADLQTVYLKLDQKHAGVGLARKAGMDEAARWFEQLGKEGTIICFDADCRCESNYLRSIEGYYEDPRMEAGVVFFEHPIDHEEILQYELFLRYYIDALRYAGFPYAYQTLGSCITVRSTRYQKAGGMNKRKAGEDFYFLHKLIPLGKFGEINTTTVFPASRVSDRVPFGTGHAIQKIRASGEYLVYAPKSFDLLREVFQKDEHFFDNPHLSCHPIVEDFHREHGFHEAMIKAIAHSKNKGGFQKRFYAWWDGFRVLKFVHYCRDHHLAPVRLDHALLWLNDALWKLPIGEAIVSPHQLSRIRAWDRVYAGQARE